MRASTALLLVLSLSVPIAPVAAAQAPDAAQDSAASLARGQALLGQGDTAGALAVFEALAASEPSNASAWFYVGYCLHVQGELERALAAHEKAVELGTGGVQQLAMYNAACAHALRGRPEPAFAWLERLRASGWSNVQQMSADPDLASLRGDVRWSALVAAMAPATSAPSGPAFAEDDVEVLHAFVGSVPGEQFGWVAGDAGDADQDGAADVVVGSVGQVALYSGKSGAVLWTVRGASGEFLGKAVGAAGDVDGDGRADVLAGAPNAGAGELRILSGKDGARLRTLAGEAAGDAFGGEFARLGDLDGDGQPELAVAAARRDLGEGGIDAGRVYVKSGRDGSTLATLDGERAGDLFGSALAAALENGEPFLVVGAQDAGPTRGGRVYAFRGRALEPAFAIEGDATAVNYGRFFLSIPGDLDGDGALDVYSCDFENTARGPATGRAYVHSGRDGSLIYEWTGAASGEGFGIGNALAGDQNGDGVPDLAIGAWLNSQAAPQAGKLYVFSGKDGALLRRITGAHAGAQLGFDATGLADLDGDGRAELLVTAAGYAGQTGATYVISSRARTARASEAGSSGE